LKKFILICVYDYSDYFNIVDKIVMILKFQISDLQNLAIGTFFLVWNQ